MLYSNNDIDIFILTYNRANLISETLDSLLNQTLNNLTITVIDNGSTDDTEILIKTKYKTINYIKEHVNIGTKIFEKIKFYIKKPLLLVFHDDDIVSRNFIEIALEEFNKNKDLNLILTYTKCFENIKNYIIKNCNNDNPITINNPSKLAKLFFLEYPIPFCSAIYKSNIYKESKIEDHIYGKVFDRPFLINFIINNNGVLLLLKNNFVYTRIHPLQDTQSISTGPFDYQLINLAHLYKHHLNNSFTNKIIWNFFILTKIFLWDDWINKDSNVYSKFIFFQKFKSENVVTNLNYIGLLFYFFYFLLKKIKALIINLKS